MIKGSDLELGQVVAGKYRLLDVLGEGGMGVVFLAEHELIEKRIALKVLRKEYSTKPDLVQRFKQEAISASRIKHPNVLDVFDFGQLENGCFFLAMEYLQGRDLAAELEQNTTVEPVIAVQIALQMCRALGAAHMRGVVHRDMKPENVFLHRTEEGDEIVKIVDFGIAQLRGREDHNEEQPTRRRLTRTGVIFGTPEYMSPEQAKGKTADLRVDIYAVGIILYEMFTGAVPFTGDTFMAVLSAHLTQTVPPMRQWVPDLGVSQELESIVLKALAKDPDDRFQSMSELGLALQQTPEGQLAAPLAGLVPIPKVTLESFRPARGAETTTAEHFVLTPPERPQDDRSLRRSTETRGDPPTTPAHHPSSRMPLVAVLVGALGIAGFLVWSRVPLGRAPARPTAPPPPAVSLVPALPPPSAPSGRVDAGNPTEVHGGDRSSNPRLIAIAVATEPAGALLFKNNFQVCDSTPCSINADPNEAMELEARKGALKGVLKVLAQRDQTVNIVLMPAPLSAPKSGKVPEKKPKLCEVVVDGLKILRPCAQ